MDGIALCPAWFGRIGKGGGGYVDADFCFGLVHLQGLRGGVPMAQKSMDAASDGGGLVGLSAMDFVRGSTGRALGGNLFGAADGSGY